MSVSVVSSQQLARASIKSDQDLRAAVPGLGIRAGYGSNQLNYVVRGQTQDPFSGTRPGVLPYLNDVQINGTGVASAFYDLQSVQVLKGPQGTLFGRSATGGAVLFTTAKPTDEFGGYASGTLGNYRDRQLEGAINLPIASNRLMARVAGFYEKHEGYQYNIYDGSHPGSTERFGFRGSLTAKVTDSITNDLVIDYYHANTTNMIPVLSGVLLPSAGSPFPYVPTPLLYGGVASPSARANGIAVLQAFTGDTAAAAAAQYDAYFADPRHPSGGIAEVFAAQQAAGPYKINSDSFNQSNARNLIITNTTTFNLGGDSKIKNIFGYTNLHSTLDLDADGSPYALDQGSARAAPKDHNIAKTDELQLLGKAFGDRLDYVIGGYFSRETAVASRLTDAFDILTGMPSTSVSNFKLSNTTFAPYAQGTYHLNDSGLALTLGTRYTHEKVRYQTLPLDDHFVFPVPARESYDQHATYKKLSWTLGVQDQVNSRLLLYATSRRAYKSGGYNGILAPVVGNADAAGNSFGAQRNTDIEMGAKYQGRISEMPVRVSVAGFRIWVTGDQRTVYAVVDGSPNALTANVPKTDFYGAELDGQIQPTQWLSVGITANYLHSKFGSAPVNVLGVAQTFDQVPDAPKFTGGAFADITVPLSDAIRGILHGDVYRQSSSTISTVSTNSLGTRLPVYTLANFRIGVEDETAGWAITANLKNAFKKIYYVGGLPLGQTVGLNELLPGTPRTFTVELRYRF